MTLKIRRTIQQPPGIREDFFEILLPRTQPWGLSSCRTLTVCNVPCQMFDPHHPHLIFATVLGGGTNIIHILQVRKQHQQIRPHAPRPLSK